MAKKENKDQGALARLVPHQVVNVDGHDVMVPNGTAENANANKLLASQMRTLIQKNIKKFNDQDIRLTPKELLDMAAAAAKIAEFSGVVYKEAEQGPDDKPQMKQADVSDDAIDLGAAPTIPEVKIETPAK